MAEYEEFRIELTPNLQSAGTWNVNLVECPIKTLVGSKGVINPQFTRQQLRRLRSRSGWPDPPTLKMIGQSVWNSVMTPQLDGAFEASLAFLEAQAQGKRLRVTLVILGQGSETAGGNGIKLSELPVEALYKDAHQFLATDVKTPVSRSLQAKPDREPHRITLPLRVLIVVAAPNDKPPASVADESQAIRNALAMHAGLGGAIQLEFCEPPTRDELKKRLSSKPYHILHFVGHGGFDIFGDVLNPRSYLCLIRSDNSNSDPIDADDLANLLRNTGIRLVVFTACQSAAATPVDNTIIPVVDDEPYNISAFEGIAQRILSGFSDVTAAVAMQFDLESEAAVNFTRVFYENLLRSEKNLDEVVTLARRELALLPRFGTGHRAWITPTVYWRCKDGKVFDVDSLTEHLSPETLSKLQELQVQIASYRRVLEDIARQPPDIRDKLTSLRTQYQELLEAFLSERGQLLGESVRLRGGSTKPGEEIDCRLSLRVRLSGIIDLIKVVIQYDTAKLSFVSSGAGQDTPGNIPFIKSVAPNELEVLVSNPSTGLSWSPREYEVGALKFKTATDIQSGIIDVKVKEILEVQRGGQRLANIKPLDGVLFVDESA